MGIYIAKATADKGRYNYCVECGKLVSAHFQDTSVALYALSPLMTRSMTVMLPEFCTCHVPEATVSEVSDEESKP